MSHLDWNELKLADLGRSFLSKVFDNMRNQPSATVRFGKTGTGVRPNYQVTFPIEGGEPIKHPRRGSTHKRYQDTEAFNEERISDPFTYEQIMIAAGRRPPL